MAKNKQVSKLRITTWLMAFLMLIASCALIFSACSGTTDDDDDTAETPTDTQTFANGNFEYFNDSDGAYLIANEKGPANALPIETKLFYVSLPVTVLFGVLAPVTGTLAAPAGSGVGWLYVLGSGLFTVGGYFLMMYGIGKMGASTAAFVSMLEPIVSVVFGTLWFHDPVTIGVAVGGVLVLTSILLIAVDGSRKARQNTSAP